MTHVSCDGVFAKDKVGLDLGDRYSRFCLLDDSGGVIEEGRLRTTPDALRDEFEGRAPMRIVIEVGTHSPWVSRVLEACGHEVLVANARKIRLIYANDRKSDRIDAECLARLGRLDPQLLAPIRHRGAKAQADLVHIRSRDCLVRGRAQLINHVRGAVKSMGGDCVAVNLHNMKASAARTPKECYGDDGHCCTSSRY